MFNNETSGPVSVKLSKDSGVTATESIRAYLVTESGAIIEQVPFREGTATFKTTKEELPGSAKIYIAPALPENVKASKVNEKTLAKMGAYQAVMNFSNTNTVIINQLPSVILNPFFFGNCLISGHVHKNFTIDGQVQNLPVCHARVHICEVEPVFWWPIYLQPVYRIPDWVLVELKNKFTNINSVIRQPIPKPDPIGPVSKVNLPLRSLTARTTQKEKINTGQAALSSSSLQKLPEHVISGITSESLDTIKQTLITHHDLLYPYICLWPLFWPWFYACEEETVVYTDCNGHFEMWENTLTEDYPLHIYVWVEVNINGQWVTVYHPPLPCNTYWNYNCNTDINVNVTDPRVSPCVCDPLPGEIVWVKRVANGTSIRNISLHTGGVPSLFPDARGLTNSTGVEGNNYVSPFTTGFPFYIQFGSGLPAGNTTHYRWKYRRIADADLNVINDGFHFQEGALSKGYTYEGTDINGNTVFYTGNFNLDVTIGSGKIYRIPHVHASVDTGIPTAEWNQDTASINVDALSLGNGLFEFVLELCNNAGNVQSVNNSVYQVDSLLPSPPFPSSTPAGAVDAGYLFHGTNNINPADPITGFRFLLRIDNDATTCDIFDAVVDNNDGTGTTTDTECGFAQYKDKFNGNVLLRYLAEQPHRYANYSFSVYKGNSGLVAQYSGEVPEPTHNKIINGGNVVYQENPTIAALLGSCIHAAFSENLDVTAYHTDGSTRHYLYDSSKVAAFAIEPV